MATGTIVVGWDGSSHSEDALELGRLIAGVTGASLIAAEVSVDRFATLARHHERVAAQSAGKVQFAHRTILSSSPADGLHDLAEQVGADLIVLGSTHRGPVGRVFLGTVADDLIHGAPCAVVIAPEGYARRYANRLMNLVVVAFDASPEARSAAAAAARIADAAGASLRVVAVHEPPPLAALTPGSTHQVDQLMADEERRLGDEVVALVAELPRHVQTEVRLLRGNPAQALAAESKNDVDLLILGSHGFGPLGRTFLGSVSTDVVRSASCPVMVVPRSADAG